MKSNILSKLYLNDSHAHACHQLPDDIKSIIFLDCDNKSQRHHTAYFSYYLSVKDYAINIKGFSRVILYIYDYIKRDNYKTAIIGPNCTLIAVCLLYYENINTNMTIKDYIRQVSEHIFSNAWKTVITYNQLQFIQTLFEPVLINSQNDITIYGIRKITNRNSSELEQKRQTALFKNEINVLLVNRKKLKSSFE
jgi:hypothetical protein